MMYAEPRHEPAGSSRSEGLARLGAIFVWISIVVMLLFLLVFFSYGVGDAAGGITEDDFELHDQNEWRTSIEVSDFATITGTVTSTDDNFDVKVVIYDSWGDVYETYKERTPVQFSVQVFDAGEYEISVEVLEEGKTMDDLEISITTASFDVLFLCCGLSLAGLVFLGFFVTGFIFLMVATSRRRRELYPPQPVMRYGPPPPYYNTGPMYQGYPRAPPMYPGNYGRQSEGYLGYDGPEQGVYRGRMEDEWGVRRW